MQGNLDFDDTTRERKIRRAHDIPPNKRAAIPHGKTSKRGRRHERREINQKLKINPEALDD